MLAHVPGGYYVIGSDDLPNAGPRHSRRISEPLWMDATPIQWGHYEVFVAAGGYAREDLWTDLEVANHPHLRPESIDARCRTLMETLADLRQSCPPLSSLARQSPLTGVTWFEATAICRFFGARLPFEAEWEAAMQGNSEGAKVLEVSPWRGFTLSRLGCVQLVGWLQEWTADAYSPRYWKADAERRGIEWSPASAVRDVTVRGASPRDVHRHISARIGRDPNEIDSCRGFRRVWDNCPLPHDVEPIWRSQTVQSLSARSR